MRDLTELQVQQLFGARSIGDNLEEALRVDEAAGPAGVELFEILPPGGQSESMTPFIWATYESLVPKSVVSVMIVIGAHHR